MAKIILLLSILGLSLRAADFSYDPHKINLLKSNHQGYTDVKYDTHTIFVIAQDCESIFNNLIITALRHKSEIRFIGAHREFIVSAAELNQLFYVPANHRHYENFDPNELIVSKKRSLIKEEFYIELPGCLSSYPISETCYRHVCTLKDLALKKKKQLQIDINFLNNPPLLYNINDLDQSFKLYNNIHESSTIPCIICHKKACEQVFMPCRHLSACTSCIDQLTPPLSCPTCNQLVTQKLNVY